MKWLLLFLTLLVGCSCATNQKVVVMVFPPHVFPMHPNKVGMIACSYNNVPFIILNPIINSRELEETVMYHEQVHVRQYEKDCRGLMKKTEVDTALALGFELQAYCLTDIWLQQKETAVYLDLREGFRWGFKERFGFPLKCL